MPEIESPITDERLDAFIGSLDLSSKSQVLDVGCGFGEFLIRAAERHGVSGHGIDISDSKIQTATRRAKERALDAGLAFETTDAKDFGALHQAGYDLATCIGVWNNFNGGSDFFCDCVAYLCRQTRPGGSIAIGCPYWRKEPTEAYCDGVGDSPSTFRTLDQLMTVAGNLNLIVGWIHTSTDAEFEAYHSKLWKGMVDQVSKSITHTDRMERREALAGYQNRYFRWYREFHSWCLVYLRPVRN